MKSFLMIQSKQTVKVMKVACTTKLHSIDVLMWENLLGWTDIMLSDVTQSTVIAGITQDVQILIIWGSQQRS